MKKIALIEPQSKEDHVYKGVRMPRLGLPLLGAQLKAAGYAVSLYKGAGSELPWSKISNSDLVGISTTTSTSREAYRMAGFLRSYNVPVVLGGIHATYMTEEALQFADCVVRGEADRNFLPLVQAILNGEPIDKLPGLSFWHKGTVLHNPCDPDRVNLDELPMPDLTLLEGHKPLRSIPVATSRGCPFNCTFCSVTPMFGREYRFRATGKVLDELSLYRGRNVFFCDDNFTANPVRSKELLKGMISRKIGLKGWGAQVRVAAARDDELLELMSRAGASVVYIGLESINPATLELYKKQQTVEEITYGIRRFHQFGIRVHGMFVFGGDSDTVQTIRDTVDFALETKVDTVQFLMLTPLPGTPLFNQLETEGRLLTRDWELYDGHHVVFRPAKMSPEQLQVETIQAMRRFYSARNLFANYALTGWGAILYRGIGWWLVRSFERKNRWYHQQLQNMQDLEQRPVPLLYRLFRSDRGKQGQSTAVALKISLTEVQGVLHLRLRGAANRIVLRELYKTLKTLLPRRCFHLVVNTEGLRFASDQAAQHFSRFLERLAERVRRLQVVIPGDKSVEQKPRRRFKLPRFELLFNRR